MKRRNHWGFRDFCHTCDTCLQAKRDYSHKTRPLNHKSQWWCSDVTPALIREFRIRQARRRNRRLKKIGVAQVSAALTVLNELFLFYRGLRP